MTDVQPEITTKAKFWHRMGAAIFSVCLLIQNFFMFIFALKEGSFIPEGLIAISPAFFAIALLWFHIWWFERKNSRHILFTLIILGGMLIIFFESFLPVSPLKLYREATVGHAALEGMQLSNIIDEPLLSPEGNIIGVTYHATLRSARDAKVFPSFSGSMATNIPVADERNLISAFNHGDGTTLVPNAEYDGNETKYLLKAGIEYTMTTNLYPPFIQRDYLFGIDANKPFCINLTNLGRINRDQAEKMILESVPSVYVSEVSISTNSYTTLSKAVPHTTTQQYGVKEIYEGARKAGMEECKIEG